MKLLAPVAALALAAALLAGCGSGGGSGSAKVIEETVTQTVPAKADQVTDAVSEESGEPTRVLHLQTFRTPSGNIGCEMFDGGARCDIRKRGWKPPSRPASCSEQVDYGQGLAVSVTGQASFVCAGDTALESGAAVLAYGTASQVGGSECVSRTEGVSCVNPSGHGFFISAKSYQVY